MSSASCRRSCRDCRRSSTRSATPSTPSTGTSRPLMRSAVDLSAVTGARVNTASRRRVGIGVEDDAGTDRASTRSPDGVAGATLLSARGARDLRRRHRGSGDAPPKHDAHPPTTGRRSPASVSHGARMSSRKKRRRRLLAFEDDLRSRTHQRRQTRHVPVGQADAAVRFGVADARRLRCAVNAVVLLLRSIHATPTGLFGPGASFALECFGFASQKRSGL